MRTPSTRPFPPRRDYASLSTRDLLDAREAYHVYLSSLENVAATAIGRYLIRKGDWYETHAPNTPRPANEPKDDRPRTLENSVVVPWSWPCVLVFVRRWRTREELGSQDVPRALYLPDGRVVPTCVVVAQPDESLPPPAPGPSQTSGLIGGGYLCVREHQGTTSVGTIGCMVTRQGSYYALSNRHVIGLGDEKVSAVVRGQTTRIGRCSDIGITELRMSDAFPTWPGDRTLLNLDAGLMRIDDISDWTSQAFGIGEIGEPFDATERSVTVDLIGCPVRAFAGVSGVIEGEIRALFFRYESLGGVDRATDLLIGPRTYRPDDGSPRATPFTRPGDSGTLWFYDPPTEGDAHEDVGGQLPPERGPRARRLRPVAMQWGGQRFLTENGRSAFALSSFVSTIVRELRVEVVRDWSTGHDEYWGKIGHFAVGWKACDRVSGRLGELMKHNQARIGFGDDDLAKGSAFRMGRGAFVPLSDVPDYVWVHGRQNEPVQHFADIDIQDIDGNPSLLERGNTDPSSVAASAWKQYFDGFANAGVGPEEGTLPFRVWQLWEEMVRYASAGDAIHFVATAGVLAHYVGDASQPLHCSYLHHGKPPMLRHAGRQYPVPRSSEEFSEFKKTREYAIHGIYEEQMLEVGAVEALALIDQELAQMPENPGVITTGHAAAVEILRIMQAAQNRLSPEAIIETDDPSLGPKGRASRLWNIPEVKQATAKSLADSVRLLADLWTSAWNVGNGDAIAATEIREFQEGDLENIYRGDRQFARSLSLQEMVDSGRFEPGGNVRPPRAANRNRANGGRRRKPSRVR